MGPHPGSEWTGSRALFSCGEAASAKKGEGEVEAVDTTGEEEVEDDDEVTFSDDSEMAWRKAGMGSEVGAGELWKVGPA